MKTSRKGVESNPQSRTKADASSQNKFALEVRIRGHVGYSQLTLCAGLEDAVRIGENGFLAFDARNPWFVQDSKRQRILILLDPETESILQQFHSDASAS